MFKDVNFVLIHTHLPAVSIASSAIFSVIVGVLLLLLASRFGYSVP